MEGLLRELRVVPADQVVGLYLRDVTSVASSAFALGQMFLLMTREYLATVRVSVAGAVHVVVGPTEEQVSVHRIRRVASLRLLLEVVGVSRV